MVGVSLEAVSVIGRPAQPQLGGFAVFGCAVVIGRFQHNAIVNMALQLVGAAILLVIRKEVKVWRFTYLFQPGDSPLIHECFHVEFCVPWFYRIRIFGNAINYFYTCRNILSI